MRGWGRTQTSKFPTVWGPWFEFRTLDNVYRLCPRQEYIYRLNFLYIVVYSHGREDRGYPMVSKSIASARSANSEEKWFLSNYHAPSIHIIREECILIDVNKSDKCSMHV